VDGGVIFGRTFATSMPDGCSLGDGHFWNFVVERNWIREGNVVYMWVERKLWW